MNLNHVVISGWVVANIDSDNATERANAFRDACQKRSSYAKVDVAVENGFDGSKKILFMVTGDSDSLTDDINDLVESTITAGVEVSPNGRVSTEG